MSGFTLLLRRLWWRRSLSAATLVVAVLTVTAAALGPLYARAGAESVLQDRLQQAAYNAGLQFGDLIDSDRASTYRRVAADTPKPGSVRGYDHVIADAYTPSGITAGRIGGANQVTTRLVWRAGECAHLVLVAGRCPTRPGEVIVSQRTAAGIYGLKPGVAVAVEVPTPDGYDSTGSTVHVVGVYRPKNANDPYWFGRASWYLNAHYSGGLDTVDAFFTSKGELVGNGQHMLIQTDFDYPLTPPAIRLADIPSERATVHHLLATHSPRSPVQASTGLFHTLDTAARDHRLLDLATLLVTLQLALLAWLVLFQVVADLADARSNEIAIAKLRGHSPAATVRFGLGEPIALLVLAVPVGIAAAIGLAHLFAHEVMVPGVPVVLPHEAIYTALAAFAGGLVAAAAATWQTLTRSVLDQWRRTSRTLHASRALWVLDAVLAAAAIAGVVLLRERRPTGGSNSALTLLAPGLLVFAVAIVGVRALPPVCRWLARRTRGSRRVGAFLATRQVGRRPVGLREAALLAVAIGLAVFAVAGETVATTNRVARAGAELGAYRVASVWVDPGTDPIAAVDQADPDGRWAMAAATWLPDGGQSVTGTVLAVDPSRLAAVAEPVAGGLTATQLAATIGGDTAPPITVTGTAVRLDITLAGRRGSATPIVQVDLKTTNPNVEAIGPALRDGRHTYTVKVPCARGCKLAGVTWRRPIDVPDTLSGDVTLSTMAVRHGGSWTPIDLGLRQRTSWRPATPLGTASDHVTVSAAGVQDHYTSSGGGYGGMTYSDPSPMPAVAAPTGVVTGPGAPARPAVVDALGASAYFHVAATTGVLPTVLGNGMVVDLRYLTDALPDFGLDASWQVWLGRNAPADAVHRLDAAGLHVQSVASDPARVTQLARQAPALALRLLLACAIAAAVLAIGGTAVSVGASSRQRSYEVAALRAVRVRDRSLLAAAILEQLLYLGTALVLGVPAGLAAALLAMPVIPEFSDHTPIALDYTPQWLPTAAFPAGLCLLLVLAAVAAGWAVMRLAVPSRLREAE